MDVAPLSVAERLVSTARGMLEGSVPLLEGIREIDRLRKDAPDSLDPAFHLFIAAVDETDTYPTPENRHRWSTAALERLDREMADYLDEMTPSIRAACQQLIEAFRRDARDSQIERFEGLFGALLKEAAGIFSESERAQVQEFVDANEFGLAFETAIDILLEDNKPSTHEMVALFEQLAALMDYDDDFVDVMLRR
jgi:hypothetical protein